MKLVEQIGEQEHNYLRNRYNLRIKPLSLKALDTSLRWYDSGRCPLWTMWIPAPAVLGMLVALIARTQ